MTAAVQFDHVSKAYRLGTGHRSLREALAGGVKRLAGQPARPAPLHWALRDVSFALDRGSSLGVVGPNGAGKTTLLKLLARIAHPSSGQIHVHGRLSALIELGAGFHPDLSGRENVYLNAAILGLTPREVDRIFDRIVDFSGLERFIDTPVKRYSSGMYVRLGFAVAAHIEPEVLLVDEVLAVGDAQFRQRCAQRIAQLQADGTTIVFIAHNLFLVKSVCNEGLFLLGGQVEAAGPVGEVIGGYERWLHDHSMAEAQATAQPAAMAQQQSADITLARVELLDGAGRPCDAFSYGDALQLRVHFSVRAPLRSPKFVVRISRADGTTCCMIRTADYGITLEDLSDTGYFALLIDPIQLTGGAFSAEVRLLGTFDGIALAVRHSPWFTVAGRSLSHEEQGGIFVPRVAWARIEPTTQAAPAALAALGG